MDRGNRHHNGNISAHIDGKLRILLPHFVEIDAGRHNLRHFNLLVNAAHHHFLIHRLIRSSQKILIQIDIHIVNLFHIRQRLVRENIIHIERVLRQADSRLAQHSGTVDERMHNQILGRSEMSDIIPGAGRFRRKYIPVRHRVRRSLLQMIVRVIAHNQIRLIHRF